MQLSYRRLYKRKKKKRDYIWRKKEGTTDENEEYFGYANVVSLQK
jgi:hypothetical protein